ncbi:hypothetical protein CHS0354_034703 [Potamilus streckersoni]|uniref:Uncharacterized protein n=1 Tax=Potamilus streckersoni TaxID=2493646 RepID=A0AAE0SJI3_9BIVA|nr:hypothetical protein CHS0354_034703 [Potamilus streckersoni]
MITKYEKTTDKIRQIIQQNTSHPCAVKKKTKGNHLAEQVPIDKLFYKRQHVLALPDQGIVRQFYNLRYT